jgi:predicted nucleotidyltransferase
VRKKIQALARELGAGQAITPYPSVSDLMRIVGTEVPLDFMFNIGPKLGFASVRSRASDVDVGGERVRVASLEDIIASKRAAGRAKDRAVLEILEKTVRVRAVRDGRRR